MSRLTIVLLLFLAFPTLNTTNAQPWTNLLPAEKIKTSELTLFDYQKAFNDYWTPKKVVNGFYINNGEKVKAGGWKQFKRWEWYWETRVNPTTGEFPSTSAFEQLRLIKSSNDNRSISGQWSSMGPSTSSGGYAGIGRLNCITFHPTDNNTMYVGSAAGGVWKTTDGGSNWVAQANEIEAIGISDIVVQATSGDDIVFIATGDRDHSDTYSVGILKSTDGGSTWTNTGLTYTAGQKKLVNRLLNDPTNSSIFYAATTDGVHKSTDDGVTWNLISSEVFIDMEFKPGASNIIYGSSKMGDIYKSTNSGNSWNNTLSTSGRRTEMAVSPNDANVVYALMAAASSGLYGIYKSTNSGSSFTEIYNSPNLLGWSCNGGGSGGQGWYDLCIAADPNDVNTVFIGGVNTWKSTDGGNSWDINNHWSSTCGGNATNVHADKHNLVFQNSSSTLFECNDGGLYKTTNSGNTWEHLTNGMVISQMYKLGVAQTTPDDVITGLQDNGTKALITLNWEDVIGGDGMECLIDWSDENIQYGSLYYGDIFKTTDHWNSSTQISGGISGNAAWVTPYVQDPINSNTLYVGYEDVWKTTDQGQSWTQLSSWAGGTLRSLAVAPSNNDYIYAATYNEIYASTDGGSNWTTITGSLPVGQSSINYISVKYDDPSTIWVSMGEFNSNGVFESTNAGSSWTDISSGLPLLPINCVIQNNQNTAQVELYAATDVGVYLKIDAANWTPFFTGMPNVVVTELDIYYDNANYSNSLLRASTFGRGLWESDLYSDPNTLTANFYADITSLEVGGQVNFTDISNGNPTNWEWTFNGGNPATYIGQSPPAIQYDSEGLWDVTLVVYDGTDYDTLTKIDYINVTDCSVTTFPYMENFENGGDIPLCWTQEYVSGDNIDWQFITGNGGSNPSSAHSGTYNACLSDEDSDEDKTILITPTLDLSNFSTSQVSFWHTQEFWSPDQDELKVYYRVATDSAWVLLEAYTSDISSWTKDSLTLSNLTSTYQIGFEGNAMYGYGVCIDDVEVSGTLNVLTAEFEADTTTGVMPLLVNFTDLSTGGNITNWDWDFGDGGTSIEQNPSYEYTDAGLYTVSLTITASNGSDTETKTDYIEVFYPVPIADFEGTPTSGNSPLTVNFTDLSSGNIDTWFWDFGDGNSSTDQNPEYIYNSSGLYTVQLIVGGPGGSDTIVKQDYIIVYNTPVAEFDANPTTGLAPLLVNFTDLSTGDITDWQWAFGDGGFSNDKNPNHEYIEPGNYTVSLEVSGPGGNDTEVKIDYILIPVGLNEESQNLVIIYPNPTDNLVNIQFSNQAHRTIHIKNMSGRVVISKNTNRKQMIISLSKLSSGVYTFEIDDGKSIFTQKVIRK